MGGLKHFHGYHLVATEQVHKALLRPSVRNLVFANMLPNRSAHMHPKRWGMFSGTPREAVSELPQDMMTDIPSGKCCEVMGRTPKKRLSEHFLCRYFEQVYDLLGDGSIIGAVSYTHLDVYKRQSWSWRMSWARFRGKSLRRMAAGLLSDCAAAECFPGLPVHGMIIDSCKWMPHFIKSIVVSDTL